MSETATCAKCMYTAKFPYTTGEMVKIFFDNHDCDSTKLQQAIERVHKVLALWVYDIASTTEQDYYMQIVEALNGEQ